MKNCVCMFRFYSYSLILFFEWEVPSFYIFLFFSCFASFVSCDTESLFFLFRVRSLPPTYCIALTHTLAFSFSVACRRSTNFPYSFLVCIVLFCAFESTWCHFLSFKVSYSVVPRDTESFSAHFLIESVAKLVCCLVWLSFFYSIKKLFECVLPN